MYGHALNNVNLCLKTAVSDYSITVSDYSITSTIPLILHPLQILQRENCAFLKCLKMHGFVRLICDFFKAGSFWDTMSGSSPFKMANSI